MSVEQELQKQVQEVDEKVSRVLILLTGNALDKDDKGFVGLVNHLEKRVENLEKWRDRIFWILIGMGVPAGVGTWEIFSKLMIK